MRSSARSIERLCRSRLDAPARPVMTKGVGERIGRVAVVKPADLALVDLVPAPADLRPRDPVARVLAAAPVERVLRVGAVAPRRARRDGRVLRRVVRPGERAPGSGRNVVRAPLGVRRGATAHLLAGRRVATTRARVGRSEAKARVVGTEGMHAVRAVPKGTIGGVVGAPASGRVDDLPGGRIVARQRVARREVGPFGATTPTEVVGAAVRTTGVAVVGVSTSRPTVVRHGRVGREAVVDPVRGPEVAPATVRADALPIGTQAAGPAVVAIGCRRGACRRQRRPSDGPRR